MSEVFANLTFPDGEKIPVTRENASLYNHRGVNEMYDHIFVQADETKGVFVWREIPPDNPAFTSLATAAIEKGIEMHVNLREVSENDREAFGRAALRDINIAPDWLPPIE